MIERQARLTGSRIIHAALTSLLATVAVACGGGGGGGTTPAPTPGTTTTPIVAAQGGVIELGAARLQVPAGALAADATLTVTSSAPASTMPEPATLRGLVHQFGPAGTTFNPASTLTLPLPGAPKEGEVAVISWLDEANSRWVDLATTMSATAATAPVAHFTKFVLRFVPRTPGGPKPVSKIALSHILLTLEYDQVQEVTATVLAADNTPITGKTILWLSDTVDKVTVDGADVSQGSTVRIQGIGRGGGTVHVTVQGEPDVKSSIIVSVPHAPVAQVVVEDPKRSFYIGLKLQLTPKALDSRMKDITAGRIFSWESFNPVIASVNDEGFVTAHIPGEVQIAASCEDVLPDGSRVTVRGFVTITVDPPTGFFVWGEVAGAPTGCPHVNYVLEHKDVFTRVVVTKPEDTDVPGVIASVEAEMAAAFPKNAWSHKARAVTDASHMVFGTILTESTKTLPACQSRQLVIGSGWTYEDALFWAQKGMPRYSDGTTRLIPNSFQLVKHIELP